MEEHEISAIVTQPNVSYLCKLRNDKEGLADLDLLRIDNPADTPKAELIKGWKEQICSATIITPIEYSKSVKSLCENRRGLCQVEEFMSNGQVVSMRYEMPLSELVTDFFDTLKSLS